MDLKEISDSARDTGRNALNTMEDMLEALKTPREPVVWPMVKAAGIGVFQGGCYVGRALWSKTGAIIGIAAIVVSVGFGVHHEYPSWRQNRVQTKYETYQGDFSEVQELVASGDLDEADKKLAKLTKKAGREENSDITALLPEFVKYDRTIDSKISDRLVTQKESRVEELYLDFLAIKELVKQEQYQSAEEQREQLAKDLEEIDYAKARSLLDDVEEYRTVAGQIKVNPRIHEIFTITIQDEDNPFSDTITVKRSNNTPLNDKSQVLSPDKQHIAVLASTKDEVYVVDTDGSHMTEAVDLHKQGIYCGIRDLGWVDNNTIWMRLKSSYRQFDIDSLNGGENLRGFYP